MKTQSVSPAKRLLLAVTGYALILLSPTWLAGGPLSLLAAVMIYAWYALVLLKATVPMASRPAVRREPEHPVQAGKAALVRRSRQLAWGRV
jgi:hypothetical protein